jgi:hypothetical protein
VHLIPNQFQGHPMAFGPVALLGVMAAESRNQCGHLLQKLRILNKSQLLIEFFPLSWRSNLKFVYRRIILLKIFIFLPLLPPRELWQVGILFADF